MPGSGDRDGWYRDLQRRLAVLLTVAGAVRESHSVPSLAFCRRPPSPERLPINGVSAMSECDTQRNPLPRMDRLYIAGRDGALYEAPPSQ